MQLDEQLIKALKGRVAALDTEYTTFEAHHRDLAEYILPRLGRWLLSDTNEGGKKNGKIIDNTGKMALRTLASGMMAGLTSPARPWFNLETPNKSLQDSQAVKIWLETVKKRQSTVFTRSNLYDSLASLYAELILFGQCPIGIFSDDDDVIFTQVYTCGEYRIANDHKGMVNTITRAYRRTVAQVVEKYGLDNCSQTVKNLYDKSSYDQWVDMYHVVEPNNGRDFTKVDNINMPFRSVVIEQSQSKDALQYTGYEEFPVMCPRWDLKSGEIYADACPGMDALGDVKQLQQHEKRSSEAVDKMVRPSMVADPSLRNKKKSLVPGGITYSAFLNGNPAFKEAYQVNARINELEAKSEQIRNRINQAFYADLFLMLSTTDRRQITAREVEERHEEKLLMLGSVLERLNKELLDPLIDRTFNIMVRKGLIPPAPPELQGADVRVEYISILHQAQRSVGVSAQDRFMGYVGNVMQMNPDSRHKIKFDESIDQYGSMLGVNPSIIAGDDEAAASRQAEQQAIQAQQQMAAAEQGASIAKDLSQASTEGDNALAQLAGGAV